MEGAAEEEGPEKHCGIERKQVWEDEKEWLWLFFRVTQLIIYIYGME